MIMNLLVLNISIIHIVLKFLKARPEDIINIDTIDNHVLLLPISVYY